MNSLDLLTFPLTGRSLIEASAGTGKTYTIAAMYLRALIEHNYQPQQILVVTFTKAATQELRERIRALIKEALLFLQADTDDKPDKVVQQILGKYPLENWQQIQQHLQDCLLAIDESAIFTIHGFVHRMLAENALETGTMFEMELVDSDEVYLEIAVNDFWRICIANMGVADLEMLDQCFGSPFVLKRDLKNLLGHQQIQIIPDTDGFEHSLSQYSAYWQEARDIWSRSADDIKQLLLDAAENKYLHGASYKPHLIENAAELITQLLISDKSSLNVPEKSKYFCADHIELKTNKSAKEKMPQHRFFDMWDYIFNSCNKVFTQFRIKLLKEACQYCKNRIIQLKLQSKVMAHDDVLQMLSQALLGKSAEKIKELMLSKYPLAMIDEFQDTDQTQYQIFNTIYAGNRNLVMIGDPKQAIYSFRGGDIFTYLQAQRETPPEKRYTLDTNWRSATDLVSAVNALFGMRDNPFIFSGIDFLPVKSGGKADSEPYRIACQAVAPLTVWHMPVTEENLGERPKGFIKKTIAQSEAACATAGEIVHLLDSSTRATIGDNPVRPSDITVLVRNRKQAAMVIEALKVRGISCAYQGSDSVFASEQAYELNLILHALAFPENESYLLAALATRIVGKTASQLVQMQAEEQQWEELTQQVVDLNRLWYSGHFIQMIYQFINQMNIAANCLCLTGGDRALTNILHLIELLQQAVKSTHGVNGLLAWYKQQISELATTDEKQLRLESDRDLINIVTVHRSKGLQYPIVFVPFLWDYSSMPQKITSLHEVDDSGVTRIIADLGSDEIDENKALSFQEEIAEEIRLLYVALTRAVHKCYISWGKIAGAEKSPLGYLLETEAELKKQEDADIVYSLERLAVASGNTIEVLQIPFTSNVYHNAHDKQQELSAEQFIGEIPANFYISSFTSIAASAHHLGSDSHTDIIQESAANSYTIFDFPKGARAGVFFHHIFENLNFTNVDSEHTDQLIERSLRKYGFDSGWFDVVKNNTLAVISKDLGCGIRLQDIDVCNRVNEMEFMIRQNKLASNHLNHVLNGYEKYNRIDRPLNFEELEGFVKGFVDLTFRHEGKYYIVDYKTNHIGNDYQAYNNENLQLSIREHDYDLQYLIYSSALHNYLDQTLPGYCYENDFGGVFYLYLRGIDVSGVTGIYYDKPPKCLLEQIFV